MNDALIRKFCESRSRWPIVATATAVLALATALPLADEYFDEKTKLADLSTQLAEATVTAAQLPEAEATLASLRTKLDTLERRTVDEESVAAFRSRLVSLVRDSGCQVRRLEVGAPAARPWRQNDQVLDEGSVDPNQQPTQFQLERRTVALAVDGPTAAVNALLDRIAKEQQLAHTHRLHLASASRGGQTITLELELWFFALTRQHG